MKAISLWQPWASALAIGSKTIETRHWSTNVRGTIAIHAAKRKPIFELIHYGSCWNWVGALTPLGAGFGKDWNILDALPFGAIVGVADLMDCRPTNTFTVEELDMPRQPDRDDGNLYLWKERHMGDFTPGRFGWIFENFRPLKTPVPFNGRQGFFNVPDELLAGKDELSRVAAT